MANAVRWDLIADPRRFNAGFRTAEQTSTRFERHMDRLDRSLNRQSATFAALGGAAKAGAAAGVVALGGLAAAGVALGLKTAAGLESAEIGFTQLLKSSKRAKDFLADLKTFAARTPFELPGLVDASRALLGVGVQSRKVIPILTALGDASGALGLDQERFGRVMTAVTQIMAKGKVQAEELMQINEAGIPVWNLLAKATGKPVPELQKLMEQGKLLAADTLPKLFDQMRKDYGGGMEKQAKSLNGIWSTFKDTISLTLSDALQPLLPWLKTTLPRAAAAFQGAIAGITRFFKEDLRPELGRVQAAWDRNKDSFTALIRTISGGEEQLGSTKDAASSLADSLVTVTDTAGKVSRALKTVGFWLDAAAEGMALSGRAMRIQFVIPVIEGFRKVVNAVMAGNQRMIAGAATVAEALHLPMARSLRQAEQRLGAFRKTFNAEMNRIVDETVIITARPQFKFSKSFTQKDWLAARAAVGRAAGGMRVTAGTGPTADDVPVMVSKGETIVSAAHSSRPEFQAWASRVGIPGFAQGGAIRPTLRGLNVPTQLGQFPGARHGIASLMGTFTGGILDAALKKLFTGKPGILRFIRAADKQPYLWGGVGPGGRDCSGITGNVYALMRGLNPFRRYFTTQSNFLSLGFRPGGGGVYQIGVNRAGGHMAGRYGGLPFEARSTRAGILVGSAARSVFSFPQVYHMARGGMIGAGFQGLADLLGKARIAIGGDPGKTWVDSYAAGTASVPRTGTYLLHQGEKVLSREQARRGATTQVHLHFNGPVVGGRRGMAELAEAVYAELVRRQQFTGGIPLSITVAGVG